MGLLLNLFAIACMLYTDSVNWFAVPGKPIASFIQFTHMNTKPITISGMLAVALLLMNSVILETALIKNADWYNVLWLTLPLLAVALYHSKKKKIPLASGHAASSNNKK